MKLSIMNMNTSDPAALKEQLTQLQNRINAALKHVGYDYSEQLKIVTATESFPLTIAHHMPQPAWGLKLVYLRNLTDDTDVPASGVFVDWIPDRGSVRIRSVSGLTATDKYDMRFLVYA